MSAPKPSSFSPFPQSLNMETKPDSSSELAGGTFALLSPFGVNFQQTGPGGSNSTLESPTETSAASFSLPPESPTPTLVSSLDAHDHSASVLDDPSYDPTHFEASADDYVAEPMLFEHEIEVLPSSGDETHPGACVAPMKLQDFTSPGFLGLVFVSDATPGAAQYSALFEISPRAVTARRSLDEEDAYEPLQAVWHPGSFVLVKIPNRTPGAAEPPFIYHRVYLYTLLAPTGAWVIDAAESSDSDSD